MKSLPGSAFLTAAFSLVATLPPGYSAEPLGLVLPTDNDAIFSADPSKFYMYTDRNFEGVRSKPWSAGRYGLTRDQKRTPTGVVFTKFHEGIDIRPVKRDASGNPLDDVYAIADGKVVYVSTSPTRSNYGNYVVIEHERGHGPFYSLYAHLRASQVEAGQPVKARQVIGRLGYTGEGINQERAHVHVEIALLLSERFAQWHAIHFTSPNWHGNYNGLNLAGIDVAGLLHSHRDNAAITLPEFISRDAAYYTVAVPNRGVPEVLKRYPWLGREMEKAAAGHPTWEFTFNHVGVPLSIAPSQKAAGNAVVTWVRPSTVDHAFNTLARIAGTGSSATLTASGSRYVQLVSGGF